MLKLSAFELLVRTIPEVLVLVFASYAFSKTKVDCKKYLLSSLILGVCVFVIRLLPINYGVHTILNIIVLTVIVIYINKIDTIKAIKSSVITPILLFILEGVNVMFLKIIVADKLDAIVTDPTLKTLYTLPSLLGLILIVCLYYNKMKKENKLNYV